MKDYDLPNDYILAVKELSDNKTDRRFLNHAHEHARLLANLMIGAANEGTPVMIYNESLLDSVYFDAIKETKAQVTAVVEKQPSTKMVDLFKKKGFTLKILNDGEKIDYPHFFVAGTSFRYELDHDKAKAVANFNNAGDAAILSGIFSQIEKKAKAA
jgi:hypothetical protein